MPRYREDARPRCNQDDCLRRRRFSLFSCLRHLRQKRPLGLRCCCERRQEILWRRREEKKARRKQVAHLRAMETELGWVTAALCRPPMLCCMHVLPIAMEVFVAAALLRIMLAIIVYTAVCVILAHLGWIFAVLSWQLTLRCAFKCVQQNAIYKTVTQHYGCGAAGGDRFVREKTASRTRTPAGAATRCRESLDRQCYYGSPKSTTSW